MLKWLLILFLLAYLFYILRKIVVLIIENGDPAKTIAWTLVILFIPILGVFFFQLIGKNKRKEKTFHEKHLLDQFARNQAGQIDANWQKKEAQTTCVQNNIRLINLLRKNGNARLTFGNELAVLNNGGPTFEAIFDAIRQAKYYVNLEYYIFLEGDLTTELVELLKSKVAEGVAVRIIYDGVGSWPLRKRFIEELRNTGIQIYPFMPVRFGYVANHVNYRNHRKIVVVDGRVGFTGGINVADKYVTGDEELGVWRDMHLQIKGPAVKSLNVIFEQDWNFVCGEKIKEEFKKVPSQYPADTPVQIIASGPDSDYSNIRQEYFTLINEAAEYIYITTPYFIPGTAIMEALKVAALSGVEVILLLPRNSDSQILKWSIRSYLEDLLKAGVRIFLFKKGFLHSKTIVADDDVASIGTANVDQRSFDQNFEVNALIYDRKICQELKSIFFQDLVASTELNFDKFSKRPKSERLLESFARLLSPLL